MKRVFGAVALVGCMLGCGRGDSGGGRAASDEPVYTDVIIRVDAPDLDGPAVDAQIVAPIEAALGSDLHTRGRADQGAAIITVEHTDLARVQAALDRVQLPLDAQASTTAVIKPEVSAWFIGDRAALVGRDPAEAFAALPDVRVDACGLAVDDSRVILDPAKLAALGLEIAQVRAAIDAHVGSAELADVPIGRARLRDVLAPARVACVVLTTETPGAAVVEVRGHRLDDEPLDRVARELGMRRLAGPAAVARVRWMARIGANPHLDRDARALEQTVAEIHGVSWAVTELELDESAARIVYGLSATGSATDVATSLEAIGFAQPDLTIDELPGAVTLEAKVPPADLEGVVRRLPGAECDGCPKSERMVRRDSVDGEAARRLGLTIPVIEEAIAAVSPAGLMLAHGRRLAVEAPANPSDRLREIYVAGASLADVVRTRIELAKPILRDDRVPVVRVWVRESPAGSVRAAFTAALPPGTPIEVR